jgi:Ca2+-binding RTX toxin-like protein
MVNLGDLDGNGTGDLAVATGDEAAIVYPPRNSGGATFDTNQAGPDVALVSVPGTATVGNLGDLDGDGRDDLLVAGRLVYGVLSPRPGQTIDVASEVVADRAFEIWGGQRPGFVLGDQNGDGRRDVAVYSGGQIVKVAYSPPLGAIADIWSLASTDARGYAYKSYDLRTVDVGDQNGDGRPDFATAGNVYFTDPATETGQRVADERGFYMPSGQIIGPVPDVNGDGRPELAVWNGDYPSDGSPARLFLDVYDSPGTPAVEAPGPPTIDYNGLLTATAVATTGNDRLRRRGPLDLNPILEVATATGPAVAITTSGENSFAAGLPRASLKVSANPFAHGLPLVDGEKYRVRFTLTNGRGGRIAGPWGYFVFSVASLVPPSLELPIAPVPVVAPTGHTAPPPRVPLAIVLRGTRKGDKLRGTDKPERMFGLGGNDRIDGGGGNDFIDGGSGNDTIFGGPGDDDLIGGGGTDKLSAGRGNDWINAFDGKAERIDCGVGKDTVVADKKDRVRHCEKVKRAR